MLLCTCARVVSRRPLLENLCLELKPRLKPRLEPRAQFLYALPLLGPNGLPFASLLGPKGLDAADLTDLVSA